MTYNYNYNLNFNHNHINNHNHNRNRNLTFIHFQYLWNVHMQGFEGRCIFKNLWNVSYAEMLNAWTSFLIWMYFQIFWNTWMAKGVCIFKILWNVLDVKCMNIFPYMDVFSNLLEYMYGQRCMHFQNSLKCIICLLLTVFNNIY